AHAHGWSLSFRQPLVSPDNVLRAAEGVVLPWQAVASVCARESHCCRRLNLSLRCLPPHLGPYHRGAPSSSTTVATGGAAWRTMTTRGGHQGRPPGNDVVDQVGHRSPSNTYPFMPRQIYAEAENVFDSCFAEGSFTWVRAPRPARPSPQAF